MPSIRLNTLYVTTDGLYIHHEGDLVLVDRKRETLLKIPLHHLEGITLLAHSSVSPSLLHKCIQKGVPVTYLTERGRFLGRLEGAHPGNVLLRKEQFRQSENNNRKLVFARSFIAGKIQNSRLNLLRSARDSSNEEAQAALRSVASELERRLTMLATAPDVNSVRGYEGDAARAYFSVFNHCILQQKDDFHFDGRTRRPPRSRLNALLSFGYALVTSDCVSACQAAGLDPYIGFLHEERPGRPSLALDLVEELRPFVDRFVFTLINRKQIQARDIIEKPGRVYTLSDSGRKTFLTAYQTRKQEEITHPLLEMKCRVGEIFVLQARILARAIRGDIESYIPFVWR
jgi:CRISPR-associated protein Cas1